MSRPLLPLALLSLACACAAETSEIMDDDPAASGSGGKKGSGGSLASSGTTSRGGSEPGQMPADGGQPSSGEGGASPGGNSSNGGKTSTGGKTSGGSGGNASGGTGGSPAVTSGWRFPSNVESWAPSYGEPASLLGASSLSWDSAAGNPENGSLELSVPFDGTDQKLEVSIGVAGFNMTGKTITAKVKLGSGLSSSPDNPGGAKLYVKTGNQFVYADSGWTNLDGDWASLSLDVSSPGGFIAGTHTPSDVREIGVEIATGSQGSYSSANVHIDTVIY
jgi:hypothetical protein